MAIDFLTRKLLTQPKIMPVLQVCVRVDLSLLLSLRDSSSSRDGAEETPSPSFRDRMYVRVMAPAGEAPSRAESRILFPCRPNGSRRGLIILQFFRRFVTFEKHNGMRTAGRRRKAEEGGVESLIGEILPRQLYVD